MHAVIVGGGVIGTSIAYFLSRRGAKVTVVERTGIACAASGKSGGFLAYDWCDGSPLEALARRSFTLHGELAVAIGNSGYRRMESYGAHGRAGGFPEQQRGSALAWLREDVRLGQRLGSTRTTAQVHPEAFTRAMMHAAEAHGAKLRIGAVTGIARDPDGGATGAESDGTTLDADAIVLAMGPWSIYAAAWVPLPRIFELKGQSIVYETGDAVSADALFLEYQDEGGVTLTPEVFPRPDGTTYVCGISSESLVPEDAADVVPDPESMARLERVAASLSPLFSADRILRRQACYRPVTQDGLPTIGPVPGVPRAFVATGHSVWGILNAPATGEAMAELLLDGEATTVDLSPFDPARLPPASRR